MAARLITGARRPENTAAIIVTATMGDTTMVTAATAGTVIMTTTMMVHRLQGGDRPLAQQDWPGARSVPGGAGGLHGDVCGFALT